MGTLGQLQMHSLSSQTPRNGGHSIASRGTGALRSSLSQSRQPCRRKRLDTRARALPGQIVCVTSVSEADFETAVLKEQEKYVLVDFWATWCGPCKLIEPSLKQIEQEFADKLKVVKIEADPNPRLVEKYKVYGLPTLILFKDGSMVKGSLKEGAITKPALLKYLEGYGIAKEVAS